MPGPFILSNEDETIALGTRLAAVLAPGDTLLLEGPLGAGKSLLARAIIQARQASFGPPEDVPSPSFTLVQEYEAGGDLLIHADLYRLSGPEEIPELGLEEAAADAILLVEWPERWGKEAPPRHLRLTLTPEEGSTRRIALTPAGEGWAPVLAAFTPREALAERFLASTPWGKAARGALAGDASNRSYQRLRIGSETAVLMDAPPERGEDTRPFLAVTRLLRSAGFSAPEILAADPDTGFLLLEDLGDALFARVFEDGEIEAPLYRAAAELLLALRDVPPTALPPYDLETYLIEARLFTDWYLPAAGHKPTSAAAASYEEILTEALKAAAPAGPVPVLRDYHAENLLWLPHRSGHARVGLLDYQDARAGHPAYDLVSLLEDARRDTSPELQAEIRGHYIAQSGDDPAAFRAAYAVLGAQRNLKILGIFARLALRDGKPGYLALLPRVWAHLMHDIAHPALAPLADWLAAHAPEPSDEIQARISEACS